jgi:hypothetical protein
MSSLSSQQLLQPCLGFFSRSASFAVVVVVVWPSFVCRCAAAAAVPNSQRACTAMRISSNKQAEEHKLGQALPGSASAALLLPLLRSFYEDQLMKPIPPCSSEPAGARR